MKDSVDVRIIDAIQTKVMSPPAEKMTARALITDSAN